MLLSLWSSVLAAPFTSYVAWYSYCSISETVIFHMQILFGELSTASSMCVDHSTVFLVWWCSLIVQCRDHLVLQRTAAEVDPCALPAWAEFCVSFFIALMWHWCWLLLRVLNCWSLLPTITLYKCWLGWNK